MNQSLLKPALLALTLALAACSSLDTDKVNYKSASKAPELVVPPDLTQLARDKRYVVPGASVTASDYQQATQTAAGAATAANAVADVHMQRDGSQRWLTVDRPPEKLWDTVKDFWQEHGFTLTTNDPQLGIMETDWAENRAKLPQDGLRKLLGKVLDNLYDTGERDKFRTRLERNDSGGTDIFISHRGMIEVYTQKQAIEGNNPTRWQPRPTDPELEAEFLRRLMLKLGLTQQAVQQQQAAADAPKQSVRVASVNGQPVVQIDESFERAWRRVGLALDRTGFTVEDRDRSQGLYFVRYVEPVDPDQQPGFFRRLFGAKTKDSVPQKYRISVKADAGRSNVAVLTAEGQPDSSEIAQRIVKVLADELK